MSKNALLLATYNGEKLIGELLDSLFAQTFEDFVIYVHDDGSTDATVSVVLDYSRQYPGRIELVEGPPLKSAKKNFMYLLSQVEADYYFLCDHDDVWLPQKMQRCYDLIREKAAQGVPATVFSDMYVVDEKLSIISESFIRYIGRSPYNTEYSQILIDNPAAGCTMCFNRALRDIAVRDYGIDWEKIPMHDAYLMELAALFGSIYAIDEPLNYYRQTGLNVCGAKTESVFVKIKRNLGDIFSGKTIRAKKEFVNEARFFAAELLKVEGLDPKKRRVLEELVNISKKPKLARMSFYKKNNFTRANHSFWMRLWV